MIIATSMNIDFDRLLSDLNKENNTTHTEADVVRVLFNVINFTIHFNDKTWLSMPSAKLIKYGYHN